MEGELSIYAEEPMPRKGGLRGTLSILTFLCRSRLRSQPIQELLALVGIACGVALLFAVLVANESVTGSFEELTEGITGKASLEVASRGPEGVDQRLYYKVRRLHNVSAAALVLVVTSCARTRARRWRPRCCSVSVAMA